MGKLGDAIGDVVRDPVGATKDAIGSVTNLVTGSGDAARASERASRQQAGFQREALDYLKQQERLPAAFREAALTQAGRNIGVAVDDQGNVITDPNFDQVTAAQQSPLYRQLLDSGEQAILRSASATGGLRSGNTISDLGNLGQNALLAAIQQQDQYRNQLLGLPSYAPQIAQGTAGIGQTLAQGQIAGAQTRLQGRNQLIGAGLQAGRALAGGI